MRGSMIEGLGRVLTCSEAVLYGAENRPIKTLLSTFWSPELKKRR